MAEETTRHRERKPRDERHALFGVHLPLPYQSLSPDGTLLEVNDPWLRMLGYERSEVTGRWFGDFLGEEHRDLFRERFEVLKRLGSVENLEFRMVRKDGESVFALFNGIVEFDEDGRFIRTHCLISNLTGLRDAHQEALQARARQTALLDASPDYVLLLDRDLRIQFANRAAPGLTIDDVLGVYLPDLALEENRETAERVLRRAIDEGAPGSYETSFNDPDGKTIYFESRVNPIHEPGSDETAGAVLTARDITERKRAQIASSRSEQLLLALSRAARNIQEERTADGVYRRVCDEIRALGFHATVFLVCDQGKGMRVAHMTLESRVIRAAEKLMKMRAEGFSFKLFPGSFYQEVLDNGKTIYSGPGEHRIADALPKGARRLAARLQRVLGLQQAIYAPLAVEGESVALLTVLGPQLTPDEVPAVDAFAMQMAMAIRNAQAYAQTEIERDRAQKYLDLAGSFLLALDSQGRITLINKKGCALVGRTEEDLMGSDWFAMCLPEHLRESVRHVFDQLMAGKIESVEYFENPVLSSDGSERLIAWHNTLLRDADGEIVGTLSSGEDITDQRRATEALREREERYRGLIETLDEGIWEIDADARTTFVNPRMAEMLGYAVPEMLGKPLFEFMDERGVQIAQENLTRREQGIGEQHDFEFVRKDGTRVYAILSTTPLHDSKGNYTGALAGVADITSRRKAERAVQESEERLQQTLAATTDGIWTWDFRTDELSFSPRYYTMLGYEPDAFPADFDHWLELIHPDDREGALAAASEYLETKPDEYQNQFRLRTLGGTYRWIRAYGRVVERDETGAAVRMIGNHEDVTDRVEAEQAILESEARYRALYNNTPVMLHSIDAQGRLVSVSDHWLDVLGYTREEVIGRPSTDFLTEASRRYAQEEALPAFYETGRVRDVPYQFVTKAGEVREVLLSATSERDDAGRIVRSLAVLDDVTERNRAEQARREMEQMFRNVFEQSAVGLALVNPDGTFAQTNERLREIVGYSETDLHGMSFRGITHPEDLALDEAEIARVLAGEIDAFEIEKRYIHKRGDEIWIRLFSNVVREAESGDVRYAVAAVADITHQKEAEMALRESEERFRVIAEASREDIWQLDRAGEVTFASPAIKSVFGYSEGEALGLSFADFFPEEELPRAAEAFKKALAGEEYQLIEFTGRKKDGSEFPLEVSVTPIFGGDGVEGVQGIARDITQRREAEAKLAEATLQVAEAVRAANVGLWDWDLETDTVRYSDEWKRIIGHQPDEIGDSINEWRDRIHPDDAERVGREVQSCIGEARQNHSTTFRFRHKDGSYRWILANSSTLVDENGRPIRMRGSQIDITAQKNAEEAVRASEALLQEAQEIARLARWTRDLVKDETFWSSEMFVLTGRDPAAPRPSTQEYIAQIHPDERDQIADGYEEAMARGQEIFESTYRLIGFRDGVTRTIHARTRFIRDESGKAIRVVGAAQDISEQVKAQEELRQSEERLVEAQSIASMGNWSTDLRTGEPTWSAEMYRIAGWDCGKGPASDEAWMAQIDDEDRDVIRQLIDRVLAGEEDAYERTYKFRRFDTKEERHIFSRVHVERDPVGTAIRLHGITQDITDRVLEQQRLRETLQMSDDIVQSIPSGLFIYQYREPDKLYLLSANPAAEELTGVRLADFGGKEFDEIWPKARAAGITEMYLKVARTGDPLITEDLAYEDEHISGAYKIRVFRLPANRLAVSFEDITEKKRAEEELVRSEENYRTIFNSANDAIFLHDSATGRILDANAKAEEMFGIPRGSFSKHSVQDISEGVPPFVQDEALRHIRAAAEGHPQLFQWRARRKNGELFWAEVNLRSAQLLGEKVILAVVRDVEARRQAEEELRASETKFRSIAEQMSGVIFLTDATGVITYLSPHAVSLFGVPMESMVGHHFQEFLTPEDVDKAMAAFASSVEEGSEAARLELRMVNAQGEDFVGELTGRPYEADGRLGTIGMIQDITDRKMAEDALRQSEAKLREAQAVAHIGHWELDPRVGTPVWSDEIFRIFGLEPGEGEPSFTGHETHTHPDDWPILNEAVRQASQDGTSFDIVFRIVRPAGEIRWMRALGNATMTEAGEVTKIFGTAQDITDRRRAEEQLRESEARYSTITESSADAIFITDDRGVYVYVNEAAARLTGYSREELIGLSVVDIGEADGAVESRETFQRVVREGHAFIEMKLRRKDGSLVPVDLNAVVLPNGLIYGSCRDLSARKMIEQRFELAAQVASDLIYEWDPATGSLRWYGDIDGALGFEQGEIGHDISSWLALIHPEDRPKAEDVVAYHTAHADPIHVEYRIRTKTGTWRNWVGQAAAILDEAGTPERWIGVCNDVTDRVRAEMALRDSEEALRLTFSTIAEGITVTNLLGEIERANQAAATSFGYDTPEESIGRSILEFVAEEERQRAVEALERTLEEGVSDVGEYALLRKDGSTFPGEVHGQVMRNAAGAPVGLVVTSRDISERKEAEQQERKYTERLRELRTQLDRATEDERRRIARELHDQVSQNLTALSITAGSVGGLITREFPQAENHISECQRLIEETSQHIRDLTFDLRPPVLDDFGLVAALRWQAERTEMYAGLCVHVTGDEPSPRLPRGTEIGLFRIAQEALINVSKHARVAAASVDVASTERHVRVTITDTGSGFDSSESERSLGRGWGLLNMRERAEALGGTFSIDSAPGEGTRVTVQVER